MGRTLPSMTMQIQIEADSWAAFRRTLRAEDRQAFDALWRAARMRVASCAMASRAIPFESVIMAMLVELAKQTVALERAVDSRCGENRCTREHPREAHTKGRARYEVGAEY